uniref:FAS1 domain-containing protein n=1 Tax=Parascaris univalens TaxID=6257 RepID=A0A914ZM54_PARUN
LLPGINKCMNYSTQKPHITQATILLPPSTVCDGEEYSENDMNNNIIDGIYYSYDLLDSQRIRTRSGRYIIAEEGKSQSKLPLLNCVEIDDEDITAIDGVVHVLQRPLSTSTRNILETLSMRSDFSTFIELLDDDLKELLDSKRVYTLFAFTNDAFSTLSRSLQLRLRQRSKCTKDLLKEHIYYGVHCSARLQHSLEAISAKKHQISKEVINGTLFIRVDNARVMETDMITTNGIIHIVDDIILSEKFVDWRDHLAVYEERFMELLDEVISIDEEPMAIFIPPRESLKNLSDEKSFVLNHVIPRAEMITTNSITSAYGSKIASSFEESKTSFGCIRPLKPSQRLCNTIIYFITQPLPVVTQNILEVLSTHEDLSVFLSLLHNSSLNELIDLESDGPYTLLIPSDDALSKNQIKALRGNKIMAENFVRRHIFKGFICSSELYTANDRFSHPKLLENLQREFYAGRSKSGYIIVGNSKLEEKDILATNGIIHILESPLKVAASPRRIPLHSSLSDDIFDL